MVGCSQNLVIFCTSSAGEGVAPCRKNSATKLIFSNCIAIWQAVFSTVWGYSRCFSMRFNVLTSFLSDNAFTAAFKSLFFSGILCHSFQVIKVNVEFPSLVVIILGKSIDHGVKHHE